MPLSDEQKRLMDIHIKSNTVYYWHAFGADSVSGRGYIIDSIERAIDSVGSFQRDLFLPNCFIDGCENARFWFKMAAITCGGCGVGDWHELEYGNPISTEDCRQRYVYTWTLHRDIYRFYTKQLKDDFGCELVWYISKGSEDGADSSDDTDTEDIMLRVHP